MSAPLFILRLYSDVKITRDYSIVHDMDPDTWASYLHSNGTELVDTQVAYYRLPRTIRIEGNYDTLRKATYGVIMNTQMPATIVYTMERPQFFWIDDVRLLTSATRYESGSPITVQDVVELDITPDVWSNSNGQFTVEDTWVERRHVDRWTRSGTGTPGDPYVYDPVYYPNAADQVGGAYENEGNIQDLTPPIEISGFTEDFDVRFIVMSVLTESGVMDFYVGLDVTTDTGQSYKVWHTYNTIPYFNLEDLLDGTFFSESGVSAKYVQSITVVPYLGKIKSTLKQAWAGGIPYIYIDDAMTQFSYYFSKGSHGSIGWVVPQNRGVNGLASGMYAFDYNTVTPSEPSFSSLSDTDYKDLREPEMWLRPARMRRIVSGMGGTIVEVPDMDAFRKNYTVQNMFETDSSITIVFGGSDIEKANAVGNMGTVANASLPIFESAWKTYQAIQKTGDDIAYNAQQVSTVVNAVTGSAGSIAGGAVAGFTTGGPGGAVAGAALGGVGSVAGGVTAYWSNSENLRAKRETIKNSPCTIVSGGSGLAAYVKNYIDIHYMVLKLDDVSLDKLRRQYYYFGYNIGAVVPGTLDLSTRKYFDYIETRGARVRGSLSAGDASKIADILDRGVRIYHGSSGYALIGDGMNKENYEVSLE